MQLTSFSVSGIVTVPDTFFPRTHHRAFSQCEPVCVQSVTHQPNYSCKTQFLHTGILPLICLCVCLFQLTLIFAKVQRFVEPSDKLTKTKKFNLNEHI